MRQDYGSKINSDGLGTCVVLFSKS
jgi:hypothetical protein